MKRFLPILSVLFLVSAAFGMDKSNIDKAVSDYLLKNIPDKMNDISFKVTKYPQTILHLPNSQPLFIEGKIPKKLRKTLTLIIHSFKVKNGLYGKIKGEPVFSYITLRISEKKKVICSRGVIKKGDTFNKENCRLVERDILGFNGKPIYDVSKLKGMRSKRNFGDGAIIGSSATEIIPRIKKGDRVKIVSKIDNLEVFAEGIAKEDGNPGKFIRVKNLASRKTIKGRLSDNGEVEVSILR